MQVIWGRDREEKYRDRTVAKYAIELREDGGHWRTVATSSDRRAKDQPASAEQARLENQRAELEKRIASLSAPEMIYAGRFVKAEETFRFHRGDPMQPREKMAAGGLTEFGGFQLSEDAPEQQRRVALAKWIASPENPLTARVIVNRLWHYHFGTGIVDTPSDFGLNGGRPSHPELLDWLAAELVDHGWSLKHVQRLIVTSAAYQQASDFNQRAHTLDGANRLL